MENTIDEAPFTTGRFFARPRSVQVGRIRLAVAQRRPSRTCFVASPFEGTGNDAPAFAVTPITSYLKDKNVMIKHY